MQQSKPANEILLNNKGASLLERKNYEGAVAAFTASIKLLVNKRLRKERSGRAIAATFKATEGNATTMKSSLLRSASRPIQSGEASKILPPKQSREQEQGTSNNMNRITKPLDLRSTSEDTSSSSSPEEGIFIHPAYIDSRGIINGKKAGSRLAVILLYNLGVTNHLWALNDEDMTESERTQMLKRSFAFYRLSCIMQVNESVEISPIYSMALLNNIAQVHRAMGNATKAEQCLKCLLSQLIFHTHAKPNKAGNLPDVFDCFYQSVTGIIMSEKGFAAAA